MPSLRWLGWLAAQLASRDQIPFALEDLDLQWLPSRRARRATSVIFSLVYGLVFGLFVGLVAGLVAGLVFGLVGGLVFGLFAGLVGGLVFGLFAGLVGGLGESKTSFEPVDALSIDWRRLPKALVYGLVFGLVFGLVDGLFFGLVYGLVVGLALALNGILRPAAVSERSAANEGTSRSLRYAMRISSAGVVLAVAISLLLSVLHGLPEGAMYDAVEAAIAVAPVTLAVATVLLALRKGGYFFLRHWAVRAQLQRLDLAPRHYVKFLDEAAAMLFLRKTGGAYQFFHVTFRDFVAQTYGAEWLKKDPTSRESKQTTTAN